MPNADSLKEVLTGIFGVLLLASEDECDREGRLSELPTLAEVSPSSANGSTSEPEGEKGLVEGEGVPGSAEKVPPPKRESRKESARDLSASSTVGPAA